MRKKCIVIIAVMGLLFFSSCSYNKEQAIPNGNTCGPVPATYSGEIKALFANNCALSGCHNLASASGGQVFENYTQVKNNIDRIRQRAIVERSMPATGPLNASNYDKLKCWIDRGAPND
jgi:hypothetical protein